MHPNTENSSSRGTFCHKGDVQFSGWLYKLRRTHDQEPPFKLIDSSFSPIALRRHLTLPWSKRYFTIERDLLKWYASEKMRRVLGFLTFHEINSIRVANSENRKMDTYHRDEYGTYGIVVSSHSRKLSLRAEDRYQAKQWVENLRKYLTIWTKRTGRETIKELKTTRKTNVVHRNRCRDKHPDTKLSTKSIIQEAENKPLKLSLRLRKRKTELSVDRVEYQREAALKRQGVISNAAREFIHQPSGGTAQPDYKVALDSARDGKSVTHDMASRTVETKSSCLNAKDSSANQSSFKGLLLGPCESFDSASIDATSLGEQNPSRAAFQNSWTSNYNHSRLGDGLKKYQLCSSVNEMKQADGSNEATEKQPFSRLTEDPNSPKPCNKPGIHSDLKPEDDLEVEDLD